VEQTVLPSCTPFDAKSGTMQYTLTVPPLAPGPNCSATPAELRADSPRHTHVPLAFAPSTGANFATSFENLSRFIRISTGMPAKTGGAHAAATAPSSRAATVRADLG